MFRSRGITVDAIYVEQIPLYKPKEHLVVFRSAGITAEAIYKLDKCPKPQSS